MKSVERMSVMANRSIVGIVGGVIAVIAGLIILVIFLQGWKSVPPDKYMLHYTGGPIQGQHFKEVVAPGTGTKFYGLAENYYFLPATQRTYSFSRDPNVGDKAGIDYVAGTSTDNTVFTFESTTYFRLNPKPEVIHAFMDNICFHESRSGSGICTDLNPGGGWDQMLERYFRPDVELAVRLEVGKYDRDHLFQDPTTLLAINQDVGEVLKQRINAALGGDYFCGPAATQTNCTDFGFVLKNPTPPDNVRDAYNATAASKQNVITAENDAKAKAAAAQGDADAQAIRAAAPALTADQIAYIRAQAMQACASNSNCTLIITDGGTGVNVNTK